ncbi:MAG: hypothetical protein AAB623_01215 [Patescibacteria group bacterium]
MEGVILNGYTGSNGTIATLSFKARAAGNASIKFASSSVLANDGQGTNILKNIGQANFTISKAAEKIVALVAENTNKAVPVPSIQIEELKKKNELDSFAKFLLTSVGKKSKSSYKIEIDDLEYPWENQDSGIFTTPPLPKGTHNIKASMTTIDDETISDSASFSVNSILVPTLTDYSKDVKKNEYIVVKGLADPNIDIIINSNRILPDGADAVNDIVIIKSNDKGLFTYVSDNRAIAGIYIITAQARTGSGTESEKSLPIKISVSTKIISISTNIMNALSMMIPIIGLLILFILLLIWGWYRILHYRENMRRRLVHTKALVTKSFNILDEDMEEQFKILKKIKAQQPLTSEERVFINQFKKDIEAAEKTIIDDIRE